MQVQSLSQEDPLEEGMATHSSILGWRIPGTEEPGGLQSTVLDMTEHTRSGREVQTGVHEGIAAHRDQEGHPAARTDWQGSPLQGGAPPTPRPGAGRSVPRAGRSASFQRRGENLDF